MRRRKAISWRLIRTASRPYSSCATSRRSGSSAYIRTQPASIRSKVLCVSGDVIAFVAASSAKFWIPGPRWPSKTAAGPKKSFAIHSAFLQSNLVVSRILAMVSEDRMMRGLIDELLGSYGVELCVLPIASLARPAMAACPSGNWGSEPKHCQNRFS